MSLVERTMAQLAVQRSSESSARENSSAVRIPMRYVVDWSLRADAKNGGRVELVLDGVPIGALLVLVNELKVLLPDD